MSARKSERLLNLLITLLVSRTYVTKARLRQVIEDYRAGSDEAFEKMFERDKEDLRRLGIPIEVGSHDPLFDDEPGYRVVRSAFELPEVALSADEAAVVGLAARVWQHAGLAAATSDALVKLKAAGVEVDRQALDLVQPQIAADEPSFAAFWEAVLARRPVRFGYRAGAATAPATRHLLPWGVVSSRGRWYVAGHDTDRDAPRLFRLSRVHGDVQRDGPDGSFTVPGGTDLRALAASLAPEPATRTATLLVQEGAAHTLRRRATASRAGPGGWTVVEVPFGRDEALADEVLGHGADVVMLAPDDLRDLVLGRLRVLAGSGRAEPADGPRGCGRDERAERADHPAEATTGHGTAAAATAGGTSPDRPARPPSAPRPTPHRTGGGAVSADRARRPTGGAREQVSRLLALVPYLQGRGEVSVEDAAREFGVAPRTIHRDLGVLLFCGLPGLGMGDLIEVDFDALEGEGVIRLSNAEYLARPLRLDSGEAAALMVALRALREGSGETGREVVDRALDKIAAAAGDAAAAAEQVEVRLAGAEDATRSLRADLERAVSAGRQVRLRYHTPARDAVTDRVVDPVAVSEARTGAGEHVYLDAWCHLAQGRRLFRLDRIEAAEVLDTPVEPHPDLAPRDLAEGIFSPGADAVHATLELSPQARWVAEYYPVDEVWEDTRTGVTRVRLRAGDERWLVRLLLRLGGTARLTEPAALADRVRAAAAAAIDAYDQAPRVG